MKTDPNLQPRGPRNGGGPNQGKNFHKDKPRNDRFFKKKFDKPNQNGGNRGGEGPPGKQWKPKGGGGGGPPGRQWKGRGDGRGGGDNRDGGGPSGKHWKPKGGGGGPPGRQWKGKGDGNGGGDNRGSGPPGRQWKPKGDTHNGVNRGGERSGPPGKQWKPRGGQPGGRKPYDRNQPKSQGQRQRDGGNWNKPKGGPGNTQQHQQQRPSQDMDALFTSKPEKVNYCLAPERLEAQQRAINRFDKQDRDAEHQRKQNEKQRKHKMMTAKTRKGQPVMQGRMELLYEKVQKMVG